MTHRCYAIYTKASQTARFEDFALQAYLKDMDDNLSATHFDGLYSTINVSMHKNFAKAWNKPKEQNKWYNESIGPAMPMLLITHALRHGLMEGSTVTDILTCASARSDRRIILKFLYRLVRPAFRGSEDGGTDRCLLDKAALTCQALESLKKMGLISNILTRTYVLALRGGHAKDVAHLEAKSGQRFGNQRATPIFRSH